MSRNHFSLLLFVTFVVAGLVLLLPDKIGQEDGFEPAPLLPGLGESANELDWLRVTGAGGQVVATLVRGKSGWAVQEAHAYPADWESLRSLLSDLARAEVVEAKTSNPAYYDRLGVEDVGAPEAGGMLLEFSETSGLPAVIVGKAAQGREGQYARLQGEARSALVDRALDLPAATVDWLDRQILDIGDAEVLQFEIIHTDGETVRAARASLDEEDFSLESVPEGREIRSSYSVRAPANSLAGLQLDAVAPAADMDWTGSTRFRLLTAEGLQIEADLLESDERHWLKIVAGVFTTAVEGAGSAGDGEQAALDEAEAINARLAGWAYAIPSYKAESMSRRMEDLLISPES